jgi:hypothetical protein
MLQRIIANPTKWNSFFATKRLEVLKTQIAKKLLNDVKIKSEGSPTIPAWLIQGTAPKSRVKSNAD